MAQLTTIRGFARRLKEALRDDLASVGLNAEVEVEKVTGTQLHRVTIIAPGFGPLSPSERQDLVWRIVRKHFTQDEDLHISMILTLTPQDVRGS